MSTGAECVFVELEGRWGYIIQMWPYGDWPEYNTHDGFASWELAYQDMRRRYPNPGGHVISRRGTNDNSYWENKFNDQKGRIAR